MTLVAGVPLDRYVLLRELAGGGMASIFLARRSGSGGFRRLLAIKRLKPELVEDAQLRDSFLEEARLSALLRHPNIIQMYDLLEVDGIPAIVMEYVHGRIASTVAQQGSQSGRPLPWPIGVTIVAQALEGLAHAHGLIDAEGRPLQLVHRDISPQNIMVGFDGQVRLFDFGIAQTNQQQAHQRAGVLSGKVAYLSPEQCRGQTIDARSDLFGMGVLLYELLTQTRLFKRAGQLLTLKAVVEEPIPPLRSIAPDLPGELERVVLHALERDPAQRYASAREMADDLNAWLAGSGQPGGSSMLAGYLAELFGEEMRREEEEHARLLLLPDPAGPPRATPAAVVRHPSNPPPPAPAPGEERATTTPLGAATSPLGAATSPLGAATSPLGAATSPLGEVAVASPAGQQPPAPLPELPAVIVEVVPPRGRPVHGRTELAAAVTATSTASTSPLDMAPHQAAEPHPVPWLRSLLVAFGLAVCIVLAAAIVVLVAAKVG